MKYEIEGHQVESEHELSTDEIDEIGQQLKPTGPKWYEIEKQQGLPKGDSDSNFTQIGNVAKQALRQTFEGLASPMPGSILTTPARVVQENAQQTGSEVAQRTQNALGTDLARAAGFGASVLTDPTSYLGAENVLGKAAIPAAEGPGLLDKLIGLFKRGSSSEEIRGGTQAVTDMVKGAKTKFGEALNEAKSKFLPTTVEEKADSIRKFGHTFDFDPKSPLKLPDELSQMAPKMGDEIVGATTHDIAQAGALPEGVSKPIEQTALAQPAYKLGSHSTPESLITEIERFKKNLDYIAPEDRVKAASYLQDQMSKQGVDFTKPQGETMGVLKQQYKDLSKVIEGSDPELSGAKAKMREAYQAVGNLERNLKEPGQAEAFLKRIFSNPTGKNADALAHLKAVEKLTGTETVDELFDKFKKTGGFTYEELKHPIASIAKAVLPKSGNATKAVIQKLIAPTSTGVNLLAHIDEKSRRALQSALDKARNNAK